MPADARARAHPAVARGALATALARRARAARRAPAAGRARRRRRARRRAPRLGKRKARRATRGRAERVLGARGRRSRSLTLAATNGGGLRPLSSRLKGRRDVRVFASLRCRRSSRRASAARRRRRSRRATSSIANAPTQLGVTSRALRLLEAARRSARAAARGRRSRALARAPQVPSSETLGVRRGELLSRSPPVRGRRRWPNGRGRRDGGERALHLGGGAWAPARLAARSAKTAARRRWHRGASGTDRGAARGGPDATPAARDQFSRVVGRRAPAARRASASRPCRRRAAAGRRSGSIAAAAVSAEGVALEKGVAGVRRVVEESNGGVARSRVHAVKAALGARPSPRRGASCGELLEPSGCPIFEQKPRVQISSPTSHDPSRAAGLRVACLVALRASRGRGVPEPPGGRRCSRASIADAQVSSRTAWGRLDRASASVASARAQGDFFGRVERFRIYFRRKRALAFASRPRPRRLVAYLGGAQTRSDGSRRVARGV